jgi:hypothetical protein
MPDTPTQVAFRSVEGEFPMYIKSFFGSDTMAASAGVMPLPTVFNAAPSSARMLGWDIPAFPAGAPLGAPIARFSRFDLRVDDPGLCCCAA